MSENRTMFGRRVVKTSVSEITPQNVVEVLQKALLTHYINRSEIDYLWNYYRGKQPILSRILDGIKQSFQKRNYLQEVKSRAISTCKTFLMKKTGTGDSATWSKLVDIKSFPYLGSAPEKLETTAMSDIMKTYIEGLKGPDDLDFSVNHTLTDYQTITALPVNF